MNLMSLIPLRPFKASISYMCFVYFKDYVHFIEVVEFIGIKCVWTWVFLKQVQRQDETCKTVLGEMCAKENVEGTGKAW